MHNCNEPHPCTQYIIYTDDIQNVMNGQNWPKFTKEFGWGLDRWGSHGGLVDNKFLIRFRNDEKDGTSYINIRAKYGNYQTETSWLCAIDGKFVSDSKISFAMMGWKDDDYYRIKHIDVKVCAGYWDIPTNWCENNEPMVDRYNAWNMNNNDVIDIVLGQSNYIHGLFGKDDVLYHNFTFSSTWECYNRF